ncbi:MAG: hypothetical protein ACM3VT_16945 [Solirubrobacterales bacterium]
MKTIQMSVLTSCVLLLLAGAAHAQSTVTIRNTVDYTANDWFNECWFVEKDTILDHYPFCRGSNQDWGWTHDVTEDIPDGATGIKSATLTIIAWKIDVHDGEDDVLYALPEKPDALTTSIVKSTGTQFGLLKSYYESPITVPWSSEGQIQGYADFFSATTFDIPTDLVDALWENGQLYFYLDIDQVNIEGCRGTLVSSELAITYYAPEPVTPTGASVYRFWSPLTYSHFYTISEEEAQLLIDNYAYAWTYEGIAYNALTDDSESGSMPVYRFWSPTLGGHFFTISNDERASLVANWPDVWTYEGVAFYAYPEGRQPEGTHPVYRFWSDILGHHFFTISESERQLLVDNYSFIWTYEGIAWYAMEP